LHETKRERDLADRRAYYGPDFTPDRPERGATKRLSLFGRRNRTIA
jgi:hypothetical protein